MFYNCNDVDDHDAGAGVHDLRAGEKSGGEPGLKYSGDAKRAILDNVLSEMLQKYTCRPDSTFCLCLL